MLFILSAHEIPFLASFLSLHFSVVFSSRCFFMLRVGVPLCYESVFLCLELRLRKLFYSLDPSSVVFIIPQVNSFPLCLCR